MEKSILLVLLIPGLSSVYASLSRYYYYVSENRNWYEAQSYCRQRYTDLATVDNMNDMKSLIAKVDPSYSGSVWIGLKRGTKRCWGWSSGEELSQYIYWKSGEPNNGDTDGVCGANLYTNWIDAQCSSNMEFVCYDFNKTFIHISSKLPWRSAQSYCRQKYTDLATVSNEQEQQDLSKVLSKTDYAWIGLFYDLWEWSDQRSTSFRNWKSGQPYSATGNTDCVAMVTTWQGQWDDTLCNLKLPFICYKDGISKNVVELKVISGDQKDLNEPAVKNVILNRIQEKLREGRVTKDTSVIWIEKNGVVFQSKKGMEMMNDKCV